MGVPAAFERPVVRVRGGVKRERAFLHKHKDQWGNVWLVVLGTKNRGDCTCTNVHTNEQSAQSGKNRGGPKN